VTADAERLDRLAQKFRWFADQARSLGSPQWERVSLLIADEPRLLDIANDARPGVQQTNVLLAAFHYLLLDSPVPPRELLEVMSDAAVVSFLLGHEEQLRALTRERLVQTNEVRRCALFLPAFVHVARAVERPLALVEVGTSAGLLLNFDRYRYAYEPGGEIGPADALELTCEVRGEFVPPLEADAISVASRVGIDLNPIHVDSAEDVKWLRALIWPEHQERQERLDAALVVASAHPPDLRAGDAFDLIPEVVAGIPAEVTPVVFHCMTMAHMSRPQRERFPEMLGELAAARGGDLAWLAIEYVDTDSLHIGRFRADGFYDFTKLANVNPHGAWLEWLLP
jgi:hypothetical protein